MLFQHSKARLFQQASRNCQQGVVIVVALFIVALIAAMAYVMMSRLARDTLRTNMILHDTQATFYAQGSVDWAMDQLLNDWDEQKNNQSPLMSENGYQIISTIFDMQAEYNLNNLTTPDAQSDFKRMLKAVVPKMTEQQASQITSAISDWIRSSDTQNELDNYYLHLSKPYRSAHKPMLSASELRLVKGMTAEIFNALKPYVTALPESTAIDVQHALAPVIVTLSETMTLEAAKIVEQLCREMPPMSTQAFLNLDIVKNHSIANDKVTVMSTYFLVETKVAIENQHAVLYTLLARTSTAQRPSVSIVWQSKGVW